MENEAGRTLHETPNTGALPQDKDGGEPATPAATAARTGQHHHQHVGLRVRRAILAGRRAGPSTPVPSWKLYENPFYDGIAAAAAAAAARHKGLHRRSSGAGSGASSGAPISARTLAATLWELQDLPSLTAGKKNSPVPAMSSHVRRPSPLHVRQGRDGSPLHAMGHGVLGAESPSPSKSSMQPSSKLSEATLRSANSSRQAAAMRSHVHRLLEKREPKLSPCVLSPTNGSTSPMIEPQRQAVSPPAAVERKLKFPEADHPTTSSELLKVLNRIRDLEEQHNTSTSMVAALRIEAEHSRSRIQELEKALKSSRRETDSLLKKIAEERMHWQAKEQDRIRAAVVSLKEQVDEERKGRRRMDIVNRKIARELAECNMALAKALQDLDRERKARELMEDVCDELAREIGEDKAEVEELRRESAKVREEVEEERKMLQMAEVWREERVQMKLGEARLELEERNDALDHLRGQLEAFLRSRKVSSEAGGPSTNQVDVEEAEKLRDAVTIIQLQETKALSGRGDIVDDMGSLDDDVHTIELSRDGHAQQQRGWTERRGGQHEREVGGQAFQGASMDSRWEDDDSSHVSVDDGSAREWIYTESGVIERRNGVEWRVGSRGSRKRKEEETDAEGEREEGDREEEEGDREEEEGDREEEEEGDREEEEGDREDEEGDRREEEVDGENSGDDDADEDDDEESQWESASEEDEVDGRVFSRRNGRTEDLSTRSADPGPRSVTDTTLESNPSEAWTINRSAIMDNSSRFQDDDRMTSSQMDSSREFLHQVDSSREFSGQCDYSTDFVTPFSQDASGAGSGFAQSSPKVRSEGTWESSDFLNSQQQQQQQKGGRSMKAFVEWPKG